LHKKPLCIKTDCTDECYVSAPYTGWFSMSETVWPIALENVRDHTHPLFSLYVCNIPIDTRVYAHCDLMVNHPPLFLFLPPFSDSHMFDYMNSTWCSGLYVGIETTHSACSRLRLVGWVRAGRKSDRWARSSGYRWTLSALSVRSQCAYLSLSVWHIFVIVRSLCRPTGKFNLNICIDGNEIVGAHIYYTSEI
jgi:hypothetical protein